MCSLHALQLGPLTVGDMLHTYLTGLLPRSPPSLINLREILHDLFLHPFLLLIDLQCDKKKKAHKLFIEYVYSLCTL